MTITEIADSLSEAIRSVDVFGTIIDDADGHEIGAFVSSDDIRLFRDQLADAIANVLRAHLKEQEHG